MADPDKVAPDWRTLTPAQREEARLAALAAIAFDPKQPGAVRVAALKDLKPVEGGPVSGGAVSPDVMTLEDIERELAATQPKVTLTQDVAGDDEPTH